MKRALATIVAAATSAAPAHALPRATADRPDDAPGASQVHVVYALPSDGTDRALDTDGSLAASVGSFSHWTAGQTRGLRVRIDTAAGEPDITFVRLRRTDAQYERRGVFIRDAIEADLRALGFEAPGKIYGVYYDGSARDTCGGGAYPPDLPGIVGALYLQGRFADGSVPCGDNPLAASATSPPGYLDFAMLHEILHTMGFVPACARHEGQAGHTFDSPRDLMYAGPRPWNPSVLDPGHDDYFATGRSNCADLARSSFLVTTAGRRATSRCVTPRLLRRSLRAARRVARSYGCRFGPVRRRAARSGRERSGRVASQRPRPGRSFRRGHRVRVTVVR